MTIAVPPEQVAQRAHQVLSAMQKVTGVTTSPPYVKAKTGVSMASWGAKVSVHIEPAQGGTAVRIRSECAIPLQLVDYGKNRKNVEQIASGLTPSAAH